MKLLLIWRDKNGQRYFHLDSKTFDKRKIHFIVKLAEKISRIQYDDNNPVYDHLWYVRSAIAGSNEWIPKCVPNDWVRCMSEHEVRYPKFGTKYQVAILSIIG